MCCCYALLISYPQLTSPKCGARWPSGETTVEVVPTGFNDMVTYPEQTICRILMRTHQTQNAQDWNESSTSWYTVFTSQNGLATHFWFQEKAPSCIDYCCILAHSVGGDIANDVLTLALKLSCVDFAFF